MVCVSDWLTKRVKAYAEALGPDARYEFEERLAILRGGSQLNEGMIEIARAEIGRRAKEQYECRANTVTGNGPEFG